MADYGRDMYRQLSEQTEKAERLEGENRALRRENRELRKNVESLEERLGRLDAQMEAKIEAAVTRAVAPMRKEIMGKDEQIKKANDEIARLKANRDKDSGNSSKPPSSDGYKKVSNNREPSDRKSGGQPGHKGHKLSIPKNLPDLVGEGKARHVVVDETRGSKRYVSDWEIDIECIPVYTERRRAPGTAAGVRYGANMRALSVYLQNIGMLSLERLADFFRDVTGGLIAPSEATLLEFSHDTAQRIDLEPLKRDLLNGSMMHTDESPVRTTQRLEPGQDRPEQASGTTLSAYIRTYSNATTTLLTANAHKSRESIEQDDILPRFFGVLSHDHDIKLYNYGTGHATCGAHLTRELKGMHELCKLPWADQMRSFFLAMHARKKQDMADHKSLCDPEFLAQCEARYDDLLKDGAAVLSQIRPKSLGHDVLRKILNRLTNYKDSYMLFLRNYTAPFTNNQAERDLRHCKTRQKVSGCFRSWQGLFDYCKIRSLVDTSRKRLCHVLDALRLPLLPLRSAEQ